MQIGIEPVNTPLISQGVPTSGPDATGFYVMTWLAENHNDILLGMGATGTGSVNGLLTEGNLGLIRQMDQHYVTYKAGELSKGQYDYRRAKALKSFQHNIGPLDQLLFGKSGSSQKLRIARAGGVPANHNLVHHAGRLRHLGKVAGVGGNPPNLSRALV
jgi:hypothetical protein